MVVSNWDGQHPLAVWLGGRGQAELELASCRLTACIPWYILLMLRQ